MAFVNFARGRKSWAYKSSPRWRRKAGKAKRSVKWLSKLDKRGVGKGYFLNKRYKRYQFKKGFIGPKRWTYGRGMRALPYEMMHKIASYF